MLGTSEPADVAADSNMYGSNGWMKASPAPYIGPVTGPPNNAFNVDAPQYTILSELALPPKRLPKSASSRI